MMLETRMTGKGTSGFCPEHLYFTPEFDRAHALNSGMIAMVMEREIDEPVPAATVKLLMEASLAELLDSQRLVDIDNYRPQPGPSRFITMKCDDRLVAAVYTFLHFAVPPAMHTFEDDYLILKLRGAARTRFLICGGRDNSSFDEEDDEEESDDA